MKFIFSSLAIAPNVFLCHQQAVIQQPTNVAAKRTGMHTAALEYKYDSITHHGDLLKDVRGL